MKQTLLSTKAIVTYLFLMQFTFAYTQMVRLPNMNSRNRKPTTQQQGIPDYIVKPRNYQLNFPLKTYYNIKLGDFISDHNLSIQEGNNELSILTNSEGKCWAIIDYISSDRKTHPENKHYEIIAKKLYPNGKWTLGRFNRYYGIYCIEGNQSLVIYYTGSNLVIEFKDKSLQSGSIIDNFKEFHSMEQFATYQNEMGNTPKERQVYASEQRLKASEEKQRLINLEAILKDERVALMTSIDSLQDVFSNIRKAVLKSNNPQAIASYMDSIPDLESYTPLRHKVDQYNIKARNLNQTNNLNLYADTIQILKTHKTQDGVFVHGNEMFRYDYYEYRVNNTKQLISAQKKQVIADKVAFDKKQKEIAEREKELKTKYGEAYKRFEKEGYYTGMSYDLTLAITTILIPDGIIGGVKYYNAPFNQRFGFKDNKLVYFSEY